ncbi:AraC family transcriptional regulator [Paenibacillus eucommiae]|uniref:AraC-like DNA-binding protein n=1 Tax=Paenibacillus eucommiae TaxID=1355755 RepID=A0ABS4ILY6_9BACL|nr:AraC family transcriptional regulator [Paenibacillus eucommiae]MBP1988582.1 AraC-like DNA-binding protein [Paenibacillus eucommiae]
MKTHYFDLPQDAHIFNFGESPPGAPALLKSIGCSEVNFTPYIWNGLKRGQAGNFIFQYTLKGKGMIRIGEQLYTLETGKAFLVDVPSDHEYYYPGEDEGWLSLFIVLSGEHVNKCWSVIRQQLGSVTVFEPDSFVIRYLVRLFWEACQGHLVDGFQSAGAAYQFLTELYRSAHHNTCTPSPLPDSIKRVVDLIDSDYRTLTGLDELANRLQVSKFHLTRSFHQHTGTTIMQHFTKTRMKRAIELLLNTNENLESIAQEIGYQNGKYFSKVFREQIGIPPGQYRTIYLNS